MAVQPDDAHRAARMFRGHALTFWQDKGRGKRRRTEDESKRYLCHRVVQHRGHRHGHLGYGGDHGALHGAIVNTGSGTL